ncbi:MAG: hypothetical protein KGL12_10915 [Rhodospirillales bacterium]|nr:hypothetical protein [Rhodospirillales bacterium]
MASDRIGIVVGLAVEARMAAPLARRLGAVVAVGGGGAAGAAAACARLLGQGVGGLISFGLAGGLDPALPAGTLLCPAEVVTGDAIFAADPALAALLGQMPSGRLLGAERVLDGVAEKRAAFAATGAAAVDLESGAVARAARAAGLPFAVLRAIADPAARALPHAALAAVDGAGRLRPLRLLAALACRPREIAALLALGREAGQARRSLRAAAAQIRAD